MELLLTILTLTAVTAIFLMLYYRKKYINNVEFYLERQFYEVLNSMQQAILLFDNRGKLVFYNLFAQNVLSLKIKDYGKKVTHIFRNDKFDEEFKKGEKHKVFDINYLNKIYLVQIYKIKKTLSLNNLSKLIILNNVTEERKIEETKKDFFSYASHELKSPLTAILGYAELVKLNMIEKDEYPEIFNSIYNQAEHMSLLVDDMSTLSRLETLTERKEMYESINLNRVLKDVLNTLDIFINEKQIYLHILEEQINFNCIELDINKLFKNLIENAIKYSHEKSNIYIRLYEEAGYVCFEVRDEGIGISPEHIERIFERFYRIDKGRIDRGTGLGLAIVKHTVIKYNGKIDIDSKPDMGTTINIKLKG